MLDNLIPTTRQEPLTGQLDRERTPDSGPPAQIEGRWGMPGPGRWDSARPRFELTETGAPEAPAEPPPGADRLPADVETLLASSLSRDTREFLRAARQNSGE